MNNLDELKRKYEELGREIEQLKSKHTKAWPDSVPASEFWGMEIDGDRYMVVTGGPARGYAVVPPGTWADLKDMKRYWENDGYIDGYYYSFVQFRNAKELYQWLLEGEE